MPVTIKDVARQCGLSISTVSKVFNGYPDISDETRKQVQRVAREIGYQPNALARALKTHKSYNLGVLFVSESVSGLTHPFFASVLNAFKATAETQGYDITFINHNIGATSMTYLEHCHYRNVDGVCLACVDFYARETQELLDSGLPCATIDYVHDGHPAICSDNTGGIRALVDYAVSQGHRRIAFVHGQRNSDVTETRINNFSAAVEAHGLALPEGYVCEGRYDDIPVTRPRVQALLERPDRPSCILLPDDTAYLGALEVAHQLGLRVPEDISLAGYDGIRLTQALTPRLTTILQDSASMGREAALRLIDHIEHPDSDPGEPVQIPIRLLEGQTVVPPAL